MRKVGIIAVLAGVLALGGFFVLNQATSGVVSFLVWRATSGQAHGGQHTTVNGVDIYFETFGEGEPLLLLHGGMGTIESLHNQITAFSGTRYVVAPDSREHGRSGPVDGSLHYRDMADDMIALLDQLELDRADIFGWSDGGIIALDMAMRYPDRVGKVAVFGTNYHHEGLKESENDPFDDGPGSDFAAPMRILYERTAKNPDRWPEFFQKVTTMWDTEPEYTEVELAGIQSITLISAGEHDVIKETHLQSLLEAIPGARLEIIPEADHFAPMNSPNKVNKMLGDFFAQ